MACAAVRSNKLIADCVLLMSLPRRPAAPAHSTRSSCSCPSPAGDVSSPPTKSLAWFIMVQALWVDRLGLYIYSKVLRQAGGMVRVPFLRPVSDERDARSTLTMLGQTAWEEERQYKPIMLNLPEPAGVS